MEVEEDGEGDAQVVAEHEDQEEIEENGEQDAHDDVEEQDAQEIEQDAEQIAEECFTPQEADVKGEDPEEKAGVEGPPDDVDIGLYHRFGLDPPVSLQQKLKRWPGWNRFKVARIRHFLRPGKPKAQFVKELQKLAARRHQGWTRFRRGRHFELCEAKSPLLGEVLPKDPVTNSETKPRRSKTKAGAFQDNAGQCGMLTNMHEQARLKTSN